jgi:F-type H+-transporting ATPase subunit b
MEIVEHFGLDPYLFGAQVINFLIVLYLLKRFLYKPVLDLLKKRENEIAEGLKQAEEGKLLLEKAEQKEKDILSKAREEAKKTLEEAKAHALELKEEIEANAKLQSEKILLEAQIKIEENSKEAEKRLVSKISALSIDYLKTALGDMFTEKEQKEILERATANLRKLND